MGIHDDYIRKHIFCLSLYIILLHVYSTFPIDFEALQNKMAKIFYHPSLKNNLKFGLYEHFVCIEIMIPLH